MPPSSGCPCGLCPASITPAQCPNWRLRSSPEGCLRSNLLTSQVPSLWVQFHVTIVTGSQAYHCAWHQRQTLQALGGLE